MNHRRLLSNRGATMLEFSLTLLIVLGIMAGVLDLGIILRNYSLLTTTTTEAVREIALNPCPAATRNQRAAVFADNFLRNKLGQSGNYEFAFVTSEGSDVRGARLKSTDPKFADDNSRNVFLRGTWTASCLICALMPRQFSISTQSNARVEKGHSCA